MEQAIQVERGKFRFAFYHEYAGWISKFSVKEYDPKIEFIDPAGRKVVKRYFGESFVDYFPECETTSINLKFSYGGFRKVSFDFKFGVENIRWRISKNELSSASLSPGYGVSAGVRYIIFPFTDFYPSIVGGVRFDYSIYPFKYFSSEEGIKVVEDWLRVEKVNFYIQSTLKKFKFFTPYAGMAVFRQFNRLVSKDGYVSGENDGIYFVLGGDIFKKVIFEVNYLPGVRAAFSFGFTI